MAQTGFMKPPIIISGAHGGGTSYVTKMLRFCGFFAGNDSGKLAARKYHESKAFHEYSRKLGASFGDEHIMKQDVLEAIDRELNNNLEKYVMQTRSALPAILEKYGAPNEDKPWTLKGYILYHFGWLNRAKPYGWKGYVLDLFDKRYANQPWGWKDPRNSILIPVWKHVFEKPRFLVIRKEREGKVSKSNSGNWFENKANDYLLDYYQNPPGLTEHDDYLIVQFEEVVSSVEAFNALLQWVGLEKISAGDFLHLKRLTDFEG